MDLMATLGRMGAVFDNQHFVYKSGKHGPAYVHPDTFLPRLAQIDGLGTTMAAPFRDQVDVVVGPDFGGNYLALLLALSLSTPDFPVDWVATHKHDVDEFAVEPGRNLERLLSGAEVLITEDLLTTGLSVSKVIKLVEEHGGNVVGVSVVVNRGGVTANDLGVPQLHAAAKYQPRYVPARGLPAMHC